ncbi:MAG TPA: energy transducer TonB [Candidatus Acidoferrum sp.]|nr:energy transducer TonB [Candidatus Acidoferrum sp.]
MTTFNLLRTLRKAALIPCGSLTVWLFAIAFCTETAVSAGIPKPSAVNLAKPGEPSAPRSSADRTGILQTGESLTLRLTADLGSVRIVSLEDGAAPVVRYTVHIETDARAPLAQSLLEHYSLSARSSASGVEISGALPPQTAHAAGGAQFWVQFEVSVPRSYSVDVNTQAGDIETQDIGGTATLVTQGGNIHTGKIGFSGPRGVALGRPLAKLETQGGHIQVLDVAGDINAFTVGGHIIAGNIAGEALLRSGGGHIRAGEIGGRAELDTDGGNITVGKAGSVVSVRTGGGQIDFGEVRGSVRAQTGGGGIRVIYVSGPMEVASSAGSICLTRVAGSVRAATVGGTITAWINPDAPSANGAVNLAGASQLSSGDGDIVVFLPRNLAANIEAVVESGGSRSIDADPGLGLTFSSPGSRNGSPLRAVGVLNGGGPLLKLRTNAGKIRLQYIDSEIALRDSLIREEKERLTQRLSEIPQFTAVANKEFVPTQTGASDSEEKVDWLDSWMDKLEIALLGGLREDAGEFQKRLVYSPKPSYPQLARHAGVEGIVRLQVRVTKDGRVETEKLIEGAPVLADAAMDAVKGWRAKPVWMDGKQIDVISTVTFNFQLH